jgi:penicillin-binding protein activator
MKTKSQQLSIVLLAGGLLALAGCATVPNVQYGDSQSQQLLTTDFGSADLQQSAGAMVDSLLNSPFTASVEKRRPVLLVTMVKNKSMQHIDMEAVTDSIRARLLRSGKFRFVDRTTEAAVLEELKFQQESGMVDSRKATQLGKQYGAEYILTGNFTEITQSGGNVKDVYYKFTLNLKDLTSGLLEWSDEKEIRKVWKRSTFGL